LGDSCEVLELALEAALVRAAREDARRDGRDDASRAERLLEASPVAVRREGRLVLALEEPAPELRPDPTRAFRVEHEGRAPHPAEIRDIRRAGASAPADTAGARRQAADPLRRSIWID